MARIEFLDHTADAMFRVTAETLEEAFSGAARALTQIITDDKVKPVSKEFISVRSKSVEGLLYDFLQELVFLFDTKGFLLSKVNNLVIKKSGDYMLKSVVTGNKAINYEIKDHVKAITYNHLVVKQDHKVIIQVVVDL